MKKFNQFFLFTIILMLSACQEEQTPESGLRSYVNYTHSTNATKDGFIELSTGDLRAALETMDEGQFDTFIEQMKHSIQKDFDINKKNCQELKCFITYTIEYDAQSKGKSVYSVDVRKIAELVKEDEKWKIASVENVKSYYEGSSELTPDDFSQDNQGVMPDDMSGAQP
jgi:hypothetical protein